ncbi:MAG: hypothetical protein J0H42_02270 [Rhizobiales bacterium]|nr:hypothetical protein [Hyphomicrobiales bacterium]
MRILVVAISILVASISTASAQFAMDHGNAAAAAQAARDARAAADAKAAAIARGGPLLPSQSTNFSVGSSNTFKVAPLRTPEEQKAFEAGQAAWTARCKPTVVEDREKLRRVRYAEPDCDLSAYNTAGKD